MGAGTDRTGSQKVNSMAYILEADYQLTRGVNVRARYADARPNLAMALGHMQTFQI